MENCAGDGRACQAATDSRRYGLCRPTMQVRRPFNMAWRCGKLRCDGLPVAAKACRQATGHRVRLCRVDTPICAHWRPLAQGMDPAVTGKRPHFPRENAVRGVLASACSAVGTLIAEHWASRDTNAKSLIGLHLRIGDISGEKRGRSCRVLRTSDGDQASRRRTLRC